MEAWSIAKFCALLGLALCEEPAAAPIDVSVADAKTESQWAQPVAASAKLFQVSPTLFRSEQLSAQDVAILEQYRIKTIINLRFFDRDDDREA